MQKIYQMKMESARDLTGNGKSTFGTLGASNHTENKREEHDFYATHPSAVLKLMAHETLSHRIWECACGNGSLSKMLERHGHEVISTDLYDYGYGDSGIDFLRASEMPPQCTCILTNPPYKYAVDFVLHALRLLPEKGHLYMFLRIQFLEGQERRSKIFDIMPPKEVLVFSRRIMCAMNGDFEALGKTGSAACYAWFVWEKGYDGATVVDWI